MVLLTKNKGDAYVSTIFVKRLQNICFYLVQKLQWRRMIFCMYHSGVFGPWSSWGMCSTSCLGGSQTRIRVQTCTGEQEVRMWASGLFECEYLVCFVGLACEIFWQNKRGAFICWQSENQACGAPGSWGRYSAWSMCSKTCGGGERYRVRVHSCRKSTTLRELYLG